MNDNTPQQRMTIVQNASQIAIKVGILCSISFLCSVRGITSPGVAMLGHIAALLAAYNIFKNLFKYRVLVEDIGFGKCFLMALLICIFAGLLTNVVQYIYFQFFDKGFFLTSLASVMETPEYKEMVKSVFAGVPQSELDKAFQQLNIQTLMMQIVLMNLIVSVPVSFITAGLASFPKLKNHPFSKWPD